MLRANFWLFERKRENRERSLECRFYRSSGGTEFWNFYIYFQASKLKFKTIKINLWAPKLKKTSLNFENIKNSRSFHEIKAQKHVICSKSNLNCMYVEHAWVVINLPFQNMIEQDKMAWNLMNSQNKCKMDTCMKDFLKLNSNCDEIWTSMHGMIYTPFTFNLILLYSWTHQLKSKTKGLNSYLIPRIHTCRALNF